MVNDDNEYKHLNESAREVLKLSKEERIDRIRSARWIGYTRAKEILDQLEDLLTHPKKHRMPNLLIVGSTNNGKTMIANRFVSKHPAYDNEDGDGITLPVLAVQLQAAPDEGRIYNAILKKLYAPHKEKEHPDKKLFQVVQILSRINTRILMLDELQHILAGNMSRQRQVLNTIKYLGTELQIPIVGIGTQDAFNAINTDPQLSNRFEPAPLPRWQMNDEYLRLLASFERALPLKKPSNLIETDLALKILSLSEGLIGEISDLLTAACIRAIETNGECITLRTVGSVKFTPPSDRKRAQDVNV
jgi:hypothetical protein